MSSTTATKYELPPAGATGSVPQSAERHDNSYGLLRCFFALVVVYCHSWELLGRTAPGDVLHWWRGMSSGQAAVIGFFAISGYVNGLSLQRSRGPEGAAGFLVRRAFRIFPLLWAVLLVGAGLSLWNTGDFRYLDGVIRYVVENGSLYVVRYSVPEVFTTNPHPTFVGSIWTLPYEVVCYLLLAGACAMGMRRASFATLFALTAMLCAMLLVSDNSEPLLGPLRRHELAKFSWGFACGIGAAYFPRFFLSWRTAAASAALFAALLWFRLETFPALQMAQITCFVTVVLYVGKFSLGLPSRLSGRLDPSYGIYLMSYPIQQALIASGTPDSLPIFLVSALTSILAGLLSFQLLERPMLKLGGRLGRKVEERLRGDGIATQPA